MDITSHEPSSAASQFIQADDDDYDEDALPAFGDTPVTPVDKGKARALGGAGTTTGAAGGTSNAHPPLSGNIGSGGEGQRTRRTVGGVRVETRYAGVDTLDEPVLTTIWRDVHSIYRKLVQVLYPRKGGEGRDVLRDWDLWGPLMLCLLLGIILSINSPKKQALGVFSAVVVIICLGSIVVTIQAKLLGGRVSFFQALCVLGYCVAPLDVAALVSCFVRIMWVRIPVALAAWAWCIWASVNFFDGTKIEQQRILLAVYPLLLFYFVLAWMILIQ